MRKTNRIYIIGFFSLLIVAGHVYSQMEEKANLFAKQLFRSLHSEDKHEFLKLIPDYEAYKRILVPFDSANKINKRSEQIRIMTKEEYEQGINTEMVDYFNNYLADSRIIGFTWKKTELIEVTIKASSSGIPPTDLISLNGVLEVLFDRKTYLVKFEDAMWSKPDSSWYGIGLIEQPVLKKQ